MTLRTLLERIGVLKPPPDGLVDAARLSADRNGVISRRAFLGIVGATAAVATLDPEALLWSPSEKTILLPEPPLIIAGDFDWFTREVFRYFKKNLAVANHVTRHYDLAFAKAGQTVQIRLPQRFDTRAAPVPCPLFTPTKDVLLEQYAVSVGRTIDARTAEKVGQMLANEVNHAGMNIFAELEHPSDVDQVVTVRDPETGISLRGISSMTVDVVSGEWMPIRRVDLLGGKA